MEKVTGLIRRGSTYSLRRRVPTDLVEALGRREVWIALGTSNYKAAAKEARLESVRLDMDWEEKRAALARGEKITPSNTVSEIDLRRAVVGKFWTEEQGAAALGPDDEIRDNLENDIHDLETRDTNSEAALLAQARALISERNLNIDVPLKPERGKLSKPAPFTGTPELLRLLELLRRADIEHLKRALDRMDGQHGDLAHDPLFAGVNSISAPPALSAGATLGDAIKRFESDPTRAHLGVKADEKYNVPFRAMKEIVGVDRPFASITRAECSEVQEVLAGLPVNFPKLKPYRECKTLREISTLAAERKDKVLSPGGVRVHTHALSSFFNWGIRKGLVQHNPASRMAPARGPAEVSRRPFTVGELNKIVAALPDWSKGRKPARYWVPLIAIFSGMRLGEIVSLTTDDIGVRDGVECFVLRRTEERSLKTTGSERIVPVHPELVRLGLLQLVAKLRESGVSRLFHDIEGETQKDHSTIFQKRFAYLQKTLLKITERGVSFHCFRHGFRDALREAGVPIDATRALGGWARSGGVEERYGQGTRPATLARWMAEVKYDGLDLQR